MKASPLLAYRYCVVLSLLRWPTQGSSSFVGCRKHQKHRNWSSKVLRGTQDAVTKRTLKVQSHPEDVENGIVKTISGPFSDKAFESSGCWGRAPLLIKSAFDTSRLLTNDEDSVWPTWDEMVDIACDEDSGARLIQHQPPGLQSFTLDLGPFSKSKLQALDTAGQHDNEKWTLVVNDVERFHPSLSDWMDDTFSFLPRWRRDDGQISLAHSGGGIGPHVDNYDVFLIQVSGRRVWEIGSELMSVEHEMGSLVEGIDVRVLRNWDKTLADGKVTRLELSPGDALYLPPRYTHCGIAVSDRCMTLSVGCRAPSASDLVSGVAERISNSVAGCAVRRYEDEELLKSLKDASKNESIPSFSPGEITDEAKAKMRKLVRDAVAEVIDNDQVWDELVGSAVTLSKRPREDYPVPIILPDGTPYDEEWNDSLGLWGDPKAAVQALLGGRGALYHAEGITFSFSIVSDHASQSKSCRLFANGEMFEVLAEVDNSEIPRCLSRIANERKLTSASLVYPSKDMDSNQQPSKDIIQLLETLVSSGLLYGSDDGQDVV